MTLRVLVAKDLTIEARGRDALAATLTVALLVALIGNVAFSDLARPGVRVAAVLWTAIVFAAQVGLARSFVVERDQGTLEGLLAAPVPAASIFWAKVMANLLVLFVVALVTFAAASVFFFLPIGGTILPLLPLLFLGTLGIGLVTTLAAALAVHGRNWVLLVPVLALPALFPVIAVVVPGSIAALEGASLTSILPHLRVLAAYDIVMLAAAWVLVPYLLEP